MSQDRTARLWNADGTGEPVILAHDAPDIAEQSLEAILRRVSAVFSPDGKRVLTGLDSGPARIWTVNESDRARRGAEGRAQGRRVERDWIEWATCSGTRRTRSHRNRCHR